MRRKHRTLLWLTLAALALALADLTSLRVQQRLQPALSALRSGPAVVRVEEPSGSLEDVLSSGPAPVAEEPKSPGPEQPAATAGPPPLLLGSMLGGGQRLALLQVDGDPHFCAPGQALGGYEVVEVQATSARLRDPQGQEFTVQAGQEPSRPAPAPSRPAPAPVSSEAPAVTRQELTSLIDHREDWIGRFKLEPMLREGQVEGLRMSFEGTDNPFHRIGIRSGDLVLSLNGHPLKGMEDGQWAYQELRTARHLEVQLVRAGSPTRLSLDLED